MWVTGELVPVSSSLRTGRQSIAGQHRDIQDIQPRIHSCTPKCNLERPANLTVMFLDCGRKPEYPVRTHPCTGRTCKLHAEKPPAGCKATVLPTMHHAAQTWSNILAASYLS
ncbi:hypothetical protein GOODEAATRI_008105 [Goodea atripinnis]|uniref:Uncharacterized protein n=1 Tax=Goodea atripinnis TaxID=208336 RepID=A0ABV0PW91_9TELE